MTAWRLPNARASDDLADHAPRRPGRSAGTTESADQNCEDHLRESVLIAALPYQGKLPMTSSIRSCQKFQIPAAVPDTPPNAAQQVTTMQTKRFRLDRAAAICIRPSFPPDIDPGDVSG